VVRLLLLLSGRSVLVSVSHVVLQTMCSIVILAKEGVAAVGKGFGTGSI
jgi:hypothetical protein